MVDWDLNKKANAIYIGTTERTSGTTRAGNLYKINTKEDPNYTNWTAAQLFAETSGPVSTRPTVSLDEAGKHWIFVGTGRLAVPEDMLSSNQEYIYGFIDTEDTNDYPINDTLDVTNASIIKSGAGDNAVYTVQNVSGVIDNSLISGLESAVVSKLGWHRDLIVDSPNASERVYHPSPLVGGILFTAAYEPQTTLCTDGGNTRLFGVCYKTGTACATAKVFPDGEIFAEIPKRTSAPSVFTKDPGPGPKPPSCEDGAGITASVKILANSSDGELVSKDACTGGPIQGGEKSWREVLE